MQVFSANVSLNGGEYNVITYRMRLVPWMLILLALTFVGIQVNGTEVYMGTLRRGNQA